MIEYSPAPGTVQVPRRKRGHRRAVDQDDHGNRRLARDRGLRAAAIELELNVALHRGVFAVPVGHRRRVDRRDQRSDLCRGRCGHAGDGCGSRGNAQSRSTARRLWPSASWSTVVDGFGVHRRISSKFVSVRPIGRFAHFIVSRCGEPSPDGALPTRPGRIVLAPGGVPMADRNALKKRWVTGICAVVAALAAAPGHAAEQVDLELVIATDVSYSVDDMEARMQREGAVDGLPQPRGGRGDQGRLTRQDRGRLYRFLERQCEPRGGGLAGRPRPGVAQKPSLTRSRSRARPTACRRRSRAGSSSPRA